MPITGSDEKWSCCSAIELNRENKCGRVVYSVFSSKADAEAGQPPSRVQEVFISADADVPSFDAIVAAVDALALAQPEFAGGIVDTPE